MYIYIFYRYIYQIYNSQNKISDKQTILLKIAYNFIKSYNNIYQCLQLGFYFYTKLEMLYFIFDYDLYIFLKINSELDCIYLDEIIKYNKL